MVDFRPERALDVLVRDGESVLDERVEYPFPPVPEVAGHDHLLEALPKRLDKALVDSDDAHVLAVGLLIGEGIAGLQDPATIDAEPEIGVDDAGRVGEHHRVASLREGHIEHRGLVVEVGVQQDHVIVEQLLRQPERSDAIGHLEVGVVNIAHALVEIIAHEVAFVARDHTDVGDTPTFEERDRPADQAHAIGLDQALRPVSVDLLEAGANSGRHNDCFHTSFEGRDFRSMSRSAATRRSMSAET